ncbi:MAG: hypothetical protein KDC35_03955 [Acidobacteria bacterium]|nr:hypothetical protein [Acidobacteriota bacterium]
MIAIWMMLCWSDLNESNGEPDFWVRAQQIGALQNGTLMDHDGVTWVRLEFDQDASYPLLVWQNPEIKGTQYRLSGELDGSFEGEAFLEMWSVFADGSRYFTRTLAASGPMGKLQGELQDHQFVLPFDTMGKVPAPVQLELNLVAIGSGHMVAGPITLTSSSMRLGGGWVAILGSMLGILGAIAGVSLGLGRARWLALASGLGMLAIGLIGLVSSLLAWGTTTSGPSLAVGALGLCLGMGVWVGCQSRFRQLELRRMASLD